MTDLEINEYLDENNWAVNSEDAIQKIFNTSPQIINEEYDFEKSTMKILTPDHIFTFKWILGNL